MSVLNCVKFFVAIEPKIEGEIAVTRRTHGHTDPHASMGITPLTESAGFKKSVS